MKKKLQIEVTPEGREGVYLVDKDEIVKYIKSQKFEKIHNFLTNSMGLLGADWGVEEVIRDINVAEKIAVLTGRAKAQNMNHALAVIINNELKMFDIGEINEADLIVKQEEANGK